MNIKDRAIIYGLSIGDGHISYRTRLKAGKYKYEQAELIIGHGPKQKEYLEHKADLIHSIFGGKRPKVAVVSHTLENGKTYTGYRIAKTNPYFRLVHKILYKEDKKKKLTKQVLSYLDKTSLAYWFMDDGSINHNVNKQGNITSVNFRICTQCSEEEARDIVDWVKSEFQIEIKYFKAKDRFDIGGGTQATAQFIDLIFDSLHESMLYKIKPLAKLTIRKSAGHPSFKVDDDIVQSVKNKIDSVAE
jgi:hypothetical protein